MEVSMKYENGIKIGKVRGEWKKIRKNFMGGVINGVVSKGIQGMKKRRGGLFKRG